MRKPEKSSTDSASRVPMPDEEWANSLPLVTEYLCALKYDDGSPRERSTLSVFCEDGSLKLALNDKGEKRSLYVSSDSWDAAIALMEMALAADHPPWRAWPRKKS
jgi:hypothetical protein